MHYYLILLTIYCNDFFGGKIALEKKKGHTLVLPNIWYALINQWKWAKMRVIFLALKIPLAIVLSILGTYFPSLIISEMEKGSPLHTILKVLSIYIILWYALEILENYRYSKVEQHRYLIRNIYQLLLNKKHLQTDYINTEDPRILQKYANAWYDSIGECAGDTIVPNIIDFFVNCAGALTYGTIILSFSPIMLITIGISGVITYLYGKYKIKYAEAHRKIWNTYERKMGYLISIERNVEYAKDIRVFNMAGWLDRLYHKQMVDSIYENNKNRTVDYVGGLISATLVLIENAIAYYLLFGQLVTGDLSAASFVFMVSVITGFAVWFTSIISSWNIIAAQSVTIRHYREYFEIKERMNHKVGHSLPNPDKYPLSIEFRHVYFQYPSSERYIFRDLNLCINRGEKVAIVGANGAGKSTLVKLLCGMYFPEHGDVCIDGVSSKEYNIDDYYTLFSTVFQDMYLLPITIREFMTTTEEGEADDERIWWALDKIGLGELVRSYSGGLDTRLMKGIYDNAVDLSGGEKQKLMIARALYKNAPIVILDEPTSALDPIAEGQLYNQFHELTAEKTAIYISHRLSSTRFCDRIFFLKDGQVVESGSHSELMALGGEYANMFDVQSRYYHETVKE